MHPAVDENFKDLDKWIKKQNVNSLTNKKDGANKRDIIKLDIDLPKSKPVPRPAKSLYAQIKDGQHQHLKHSTYQSTSSNTNIHNSTILSEQQTFKNLTQNLSPYIDKYLYTSEISEDTNSRDHSNHIINNSQSKEFKYNNELNVNQSSKSIHIFNSKNEQENLDNQLSTDDENRKIMDDPFNNPLNISNFDLSDEKMINEDELLKNQNENSDKVLRMSEEQVKKEIDELKQQMDPSILALLKRHSAPKFSSMNITQDPILNSPHQLDEQSSNDNINGPIIPEDECIELKIQKTKTGIKTNLNPQAIVQQDNPQNTKRKEVISKLETLSNLDLNQNMLKKVTISSLGVLQFEAGFVHCEEEEDRELEDLHTLYDILWLCQFVHKQRIQLAIHSILSILHNITNTQLDYSSFNSTQFHDITNHKQLEFNSYSEAVIWMLFREMNIVQVLRNLLNNESSVIIQKLSEVMCRVLQLSWKYQFLQQGEEQQKDEEWVGAKVILMSKLFHTVKPTHNCLIEKHARPNKHKYGGEPTHFSMYVNNYQDHTLPQFNQESDFHCFRQDPIGALVKSRSIERFLYLIYQYIHKLNYNKPEDLTFIANTTDIFIFLLSHHSSIVPCLLVNCRQFYDQAKIIINNQIQKVSLIANKFINLLSTIIKSGEHIKIKIILKNLNLDCVQLMIKHPKLERSCIEYLISLLLIGEQEIDSSIDMALFEWISVKMNEFNNNISKTKEDQTLIILILEFIYYYISVIAMFQDKDTNIYKIFIRKNIQFLNNYILDFDYRIQQNKIICAQTFCFNEKIDVLESQNSQIELILDNISKIMERNDDMELKQISLLFNNANDLIIGNQIELEYFKLLDPYQSLLTLFSTRNTTFGYILIFQQIEFLVNHVQITSQSKHLILHYAIHQITNIRINCEQIAQYQLENIIFSKEFIKNSLFEIDLIKSNFSTILNDEFLVKRSQNLITNTPGQIIKQYDNPGFNSQIPLDQNWIQLGMYTIDTHLIIQNSKFINQLLQSYEFINQFQIDKFQINQMLIEEFKFRFNPLILFDSLFDFIKTDQRYNIEVISSIKNLIISILRYISKSKCHLQLLNQDLRLQISKFETILKLIVDDLIKSQEWTFIMIILMKYVEFRDICLSILIENYKVILNFDSSFPQILKLENKDVYDDLYQSQSQCMKGKENMVRSQLNKLPKINGIIGLFSLNLLIDQFLKSSLSERDNITLNIKRLFKDNYNFFKKKQNENLNVISSMME